MTAFAAWLLTNLKMILFFVLGLFFSILALAWDFIIDLLPLEQLNNQLIPVLDAVPDSVWYFANVVELPYAFIVVTTGYLTRFLIRRIPIIG